MLKTRKIRQNLKPESHTYPYLAVAEPPVERALSFATRHGKTAPWMPSAGPRAPLETQDWWCANRSWRRNGKKKQCQFIIGIEEEKGGSMWKCWKCWTDMDRWLLFFLLIRLDLPRLSAVMLHAYTFSWLWTAMLTLCIRRRTLFSELGGACWAQMGAWKDFKIGWAAVQQTSGIHQFGAGSQVKHEVHRSENRRFLGRSTEKRVTDSVSDCHRFYEKGAWSCDVLNESNESNEF